MRTKMVQINNSAFSVLWIQNDKSFMVIRIPILIWVKGGKQMQIHADYYCKVFK